MKQQQGCLFVTAKIGDSIWIGSTKIIVLEIAGKVRLRIEGDRKTAVEYVARPKANLRG